MPRNIIGGKLAAATKVETGRRGMACQRPEGRDYSVIGRVLAGLSIIIVYLRFQRKRSQVKVSIVANVSDTLRRTTPVCARGARSVCVPMQ